MIDFNAYKDGKLHVLTMSYDDGPSQDRTLTKIFDCYGIRGTFHLNSERLTGNDGSITRDEVAKIYKNHEVAVHTVHHPWLEKMPAQSVINEVLEDRRAIEACCGYVVRGMSYPFGTYSNDVIAALRACGIVYSRTVAPTNSFCLPQDFMVWTPTCHHNECEALVERFVSSLDNPWFSGVFYIWGHSYEFDSDTDKSWDYIEGICKKLSGHNQVWYATNIELYDYVMAQRALHISVDEKIIHNPSAADVWIRVDKKPIKISGGETVLL